ncbi:VQ motif-containing protein 11-like [Arachis stenosperma]|uniref:VQ motif-containing protein 11-like n=1 Tax=Arachis stenosperma TaxID=217475 RepID=UPI0025AD28DB|nr:VQ motif-containing protein 11-like [Arachis stenosperma]
MHIHRGSSSYSWDAARIGNTTFVQADPSNFREVVQKLTGAPKKKAAAASFKLQERRHAYAAKKLELTIGGLSERPPFFTDATTPSSSSVSSASPVSPLQMEMEDRVITHKGFYLLPSPSSSHHYRHTTPQLLSLFPLHNNQTNSH